MVSTAWRVSGPHCMEGEWSALHGGRVVSTAWRVSGPHCMEGEWSALHGG